jgi:hypothetical protein
VKVLLYHPPADPHGEWTSEIVDESMHMTHNFDVLGTIRNRYADGLMVAGKENFGYRVRRDGEWKNITADMIRGSGKNFAGAGEIRSFALPDTEILSFASVEPMHGNQLVFNTNQSGNLERHVLTDKLIEGHALACGDLLGVKRGQIVVGWRGNPSRADNNFGIHLWTPLDAAGEHWRESAVDDGGMACEDLVLADLDGDGRLVIIASGRATKNVKIYFNETH